MHNRGHKPTCREPTMEKQFKPRRIFALGACAVLGTALAGLSAAAEPGAHAAMTPASGSQANGTVTIHATSGGVHLDVKITGLSPGVHGFHVHEIGDCSAADASS